MSRKITTGRVGRAVLGNLTTVNNSLQSVVANANVLLEPNGTGIAVSTSDLQINSANALRLADSDSSNYIALKSPATVSSNITYTLPGSGVTADYFLKTDASGVLSWALAAVSVSNQTADSSTYYPTITTATTGTLTAISTSSTKLTFQPSTGALAATSFSGNITSSSATITGGTINGTIIGGTTAANGTFAALVAASITETSSIAYKENVLPIENALESVMQLVGVTYDRKDGTKKSEAGLIAEQVAPIIPNVVTFKDGKPEGINYTKLSAYLIEAVKTLKNEINELKGIK